ncbi:MAG: double zinc ribbon domain-containing protein [Roseburia sp.]|nr:double zinc ribbon domain-containing protein [Roseburia sp.]MCM1278304.1 double zinc ribbon domain-containing protein [Robinsoniella sp.]
MESMNFIKELIYPGRCAICDDILLPGTGKVCQGCKNKPKHVKEPVCRKCGKPLRNPEAEYCRDCMERKHYFKEGAALFVYSSIKESIYRFKYEGRQEYGAYYGEQVRLHLAEKIRRWRPEALIPVPLHKKRLQKRGYNQAAVFAKAISRETGIPVYENFAERIRNTVPQKELNGQERENNLKKAFKIRQNEVKLKVIIIIDDIYTTGSTMDALALECKKAGIETVYCISLAIGALK